MKLRSYLRGIGIGVLVTAAVFIVSGSVSPKTAMTDEQVIARAKELGMIEDTVLSELASANDDSLAQITEAVEDTVDETEQVVDASDEGAAEVEITAEPTVEAVPTPEPTKEVVPTPEPTKEVVPTPEPTKEVVPTPEPTKKAEPTKEPEIDTKEVIIVVNSGDGSDTVARKLYDAGLVADAREFDLYLMANGYDRRITTGNHKISITASQEEIAKNLVSSTK